MSGGKLLLELIELTQQRLCEFFAANAATLIEVEAIEHLGVVALKILREQRTVAIDIAHGKGGINDASHHLLRGRWRHRCRGRSLGYLRRTRRTRSVQLHGEIHRVDATVAVVIAAFALQLSGRAPILEHPALGVGRAVQRDRQVLAVDDAIAVEVVLGVRAAPMLHERLHRHHRGFGAAEGDAFGATGGRTGRRRRDARNRCVRTNCR